jgi:transposase
METAMKIRRLVLVEGRSIRSVSKTTGISRNTIRKYLQDDSPPNYRRSQPPFAPILRGFETKLTDWYTFDLTRPKREKRTAKKLYEQLVEEGYAGSYYPVCRFIKTLKEDHTSSSDGFIPMRFDAGDAMQFDWSQEVVVLGGVEQKIKVGHFKLSYSRKPFVIAYPRETQEMLLDAYIQAFVFYQGVPQRVLIDNPRTMIKRIGKGKEREFHPRFLALMNHYLIDPVACTPASGWEKGQVERQVHYLRKEIFTPMLKFDDIDALNTYLLARCDGLGDKAHPERKSQTIDEVFTQEQTQLRPLGRPFDGYVEKAHRATSTCLVQYDSNYYSVPAQYAKKSLSLRAYAREIVIYDKQQRVARHPRCFGKHEYLFEPWHYVPLLKQKPGALRDGAPFKQWQLPVAINTIKHQYLKRIGGDREFVALLQLIQAHNIELVTTACERAIEEKTTQLAAIINLINRLIEPCIDLIDIPRNYPQLTVLPQANCKRYEQLLRFGGSSL